MPERLAEAVDGEECGGHGAGLQAFDTFRTPVDVGETQPHGKLVDGQTQSNPEDDRDPEVPPRIPRGKRGKAGNHQEQDAPEEMMDVKPAPRDDDGMLAHA